MLFEITIGLNISPEDSIMLSEILDSEASEPAEAVKLAIESLLDDMGADKYKVVVREGE